jgi:Ca-activated chloride channel homolog
MTFDLSTWSFEAPVFLWGLVLVPLLILLRERSVAGHPPWRSFGALIARCLAIALLCVAAARPMEDVERPDRSLVVAVDSSASVGTSRREAGEQWLRDLWEARDDVPTRLVVGTDPAVVTDDLDVAIDSLGRVGAGGTDLRNLLEQALASLPPARHQEVVLLSDGVATRGRVDEAVRVASARDLAIHTVGLGPSELQARVVDVQPEQDLLVGQNVPVTVQVATNAPIETTVVLSAKSGDVARTTASLPVGVTSLTLAWTPPGPGMHRVTATVEGNEGDARPEDDSLDAVLRVQPRPAALLVGEASAAKALRGAVAGFKPALHIDEVRALPSPPYADYRLIVLLDPDLPDLGAERADGLRTWTRDGGRLLVTGGEGGLITDSPALDPLKAILPVRFPKTKKKEQVPLAVVYCLDSSDSMAGGAKFELAAAALSNSLQLLPEQAEVGVVNFADFPSWAYPLQPFGGANPVIDAMTSVKVRGGTSIYHALQSAYTTLKESEALVKHVVLLSDGQSTTTFTRSGDIVTAMARNKITVTTIAVSDDSDRSEMERIAEAGRGRAHYTQSFRDLPQLFLDEMMLVTRTNKVNKDFAVHPVVGSRVLTGIPKGATYPSLAGYVRGEQRAGTELSLATADGHPVLVSGRNGRGVITMFTSDVGGPWSAAWPEWEHHGTLWEGVIEAMLRPSPPERSSLSATRLDDRVRLQFDAVDAMRNPRGDLLVEAVLHRLDGSRETTQLLPVGPGRYGGSLPLPDSGASLVGVAAVGITGEEGGGLPPGGELSLSVTRPPSEEIRAATYNPQLLRGIAEQTGGIWNPRPAQILEATVPKRVDRESRWPPPLWAGLILLVIDLAWRRLRIPGRT